MKFLFNIKFRKYILMLIDFLSVIFVSIISVGVFFALKISDISIFDHFGSIILFSALNVVFLILLKNYLIVWRYARTKEFLSCILGIMAATLCYVIATYFIYNIQYSMFFLMCGLFSIVFICLMRALYVFVYFYSECRIKNNSTNRVMIVGAGDAGRHICELMFVENKKYNPVVFIDDNSEKIGRNINGIPIMGNTNEIVKIAEDMNISEIVLAIPSIDKSNRARILGICSETMCKVNVLPQLDQYIQTDKIQKQMQSVKIEDLLSRDVVKLDNKQTIDMIKGKVCMVTGGGGSIGSELVRQIAKMQPEKLIIVDIYENNAYNIQQELLFKYGNKLDLSVQIASVRDIKKMDMLFNELKPDLIFHAAAHKHVPLMETNPEESVKNNIFGTLNVATLADKYNCEKFVLVSTDKAVNPTNIMGATKRCCEMIVECMAQRKTKTEFVAVRFGNVLGSNGSVIPLFEKQIANGGPVTVTDPRIIRYFMTIPEAASLILQAATLAHGGEIFVLDMGEPVKILKLAEDIIKLHGYRPYKDIDIKFVGLRPGEKLYEELLMNEEGLKNTANNKIFIGKQVKVDETEFFAQLEKLKEAAMNNDKVSVESLMHEIVPTFVRKKAEDNISEKVADR